MTADARRATDDRLVVDTAYGPVRGTDDVAHGHSALEPVRWKASGLPREHLRRQPKAATDRAGIHHLDGHAGGGADSLRRR